MSVVVVDADVDAGEDPCKPDVSIADAAVAYVKLNNYLEERERVCSDQPKAPDPVGLWQENCCDECPKNEYDGPLPGYGNNLRHASSSTPFVSVLLSDRHLVDIVLLRL